MLERKIDLRSVSALVHTAQVTIASPPPTLADTLADAALAVGRLAEAVRRSPVAPAWKLRETAYVAAAVASRHFGPSRADNLFAIVAGAPDARIRADEQTLLALEFWRQALKQWFATELPSPWIPLDEAELGDKEGEQEDVWDEDPWPVVSAGGRDSTTVVAAMGDGRSPSFAVVIRAAIAAWRTDHGSGRIELALPLGMKPQLGTVLPTLALGMPPARRRRDGGEALMARCVARLGIEAEAAYVRLLGLERAWEDWHERLPDRRIHSRLPDVLRLLARSLMLTARGVAAALNVTPRAASGHLNVLAALKIVREVSGRPRWRLFCAYDLPLKPFARAQSRVRHGGTVDAPNVSLDLSEVSRPVRAAPVDLGAIHQMLADAYREVSAATARVDALLSSTRPDTKE